MRESNMDSAEKHNNLISGLLMVTIIIAVIVMLVLIKPGDKKPKEALSGQFTTEETALITGSDSVMYVLNASDSADLKILRTASTELNDAALQSDAFRTLTGKMLSTVNAPEEGGVGIAAPQVGVNRRIVAVMRVDKEGEPFEVYANIQIDSLYGDMVKGREGCLSVPTLRGNVMRYPNAIVSYKDPVTLQMLRDTVSGFAAVIFQHECDHLDGILYTDKADSVMVDPASKAEYDAFAAAGKYKKKN